jgi:hypothetical protein
MKPSGVNQQLGDFLRKRREKLKPKDVGLPSASASWLGNFAPLDFRVGRLSRAEASHLQLREKKPSRLN